MKKLFSFFIVSLFFVLGTMNAQQLSNLDFENFKADDYNSNVGVTPIGWYASNLYKNVGITVTKQLVFEDANGRSGKCVLMENGEAGAMGIVEVSPSWISLGKPWNYISGLQTGTATAGTDGGIQWTYRPDTMAVWIKRIDNNGENAHLVVYLWKGTSQGDSYKSKNGGCSSTTHYDEESDIRQAFDGNDCGTTTLATQIGEGMWRNNQSFSNWTEIKVPITYLNNDVPEKMNIIFSAANYPNKRDNVVNKGSKLYVDDLRFIYSSVAHEILLNNRAMSGFSPSQTSYVYTLGAGVTSIPTITVKRSGRLLSASEYTVYPGPIGGDTRIVITAEDGSSSTTYTITFVNELSKNARPSNIKYNGTSLPNFNPYVYNYNVELPFGTTTVPSIDVVYAESGQSHTVVNPTSLPGTATVTVSAPDVAYTQQYTINYTLAALTDNTLTDIQVNGKTITGFSPTTNNYVVELPIGTTTDPVITWSTNYPSDQTIVLDNQGISGGATISVTPNGTNLTRTYRLRFVISASTYSYLNDISVDGTPIAEFSPSQMSYTVTLAEGDTAMPVITWTPGDEYQQIVYENNGVDATSKITVTSQSGSVSVYRITVQTVRSANSSLNNIFIDGVALADFNPSVYTYTYNLPVGTQIMPDITWTAGDQYQSINFVSGGLTGTSRIVVSAQDGSISTYQISFVIAQSTNDALASILLDGVEIADFDSEVLNYAVQLPRGTVSLPNITWVAGDAYQTIRKVEGGINGDTRITVKSQAGTSRVYTISFSVSIDANNSLSDILVGEESIDNFHSDTLIFNYILPSGTLTLPQISVVKGSESQRVSIQKGGVNGTTTITVIAENGDTKVYSINFSVQKSENAFLNMIYIDGDSLPGFDSSILNYDVEIPASSTACPIITVDKQFGQDITLLLPKVTGLVRIDVKPESGSSNVYTINIHFPQSDNTLLNSIMIDGVEVEDFNSNVRDYTITLATGVTVLPQITYQKAEVDQVVYVNKGTLNTPTEISVKAENGNVGTYTLTFVPSYSSNSKLNAIYLNGALIDGFDSDITAYNYVMDVDAVSAPTITYSKGDAAQQVILSSPAFEGLAEIVVVSPDYSDTTIYNVSFVKAKRNNATLSNIALNGEFIDMALFNNTDTAVVDWRSVDAAPVITYQKADEHQFVAIADGKMNGSELVVVAEDGSVKEYVTRYNIVRNGNAKLKDIKLLNNSSNWVDIATYTSVFSYLPQNGSMEVEEFVVNLPWRTATVPMIQPVTDFGQKVKINYGALNETTTIEVTSEDGAATKVYSINFVVEKSAVSSLSDVYIDGVSLINFTPDTYNYNVVLPYGTKSAPYITWEKAIAENGSFIDEERVEYFNGGLYRPSTIKVFAENGDSSVYTFNFIVEDSNLENQLNMIYVNGAPLAGFASDVFYYDVVLPYGTTTAPTIGVVKKFATQSTEIKVNGVTGSANILVYANNSTNDVALYTIKFTISNVESVHLTSATIDGASVPYFNPATTTYVVSTTNDAVSYSFTCSDGADYSIEEENSNRIVVKVYSLTSSDSLLYTIYLHHTNDVIPNADFSSWSATKYNNAQKPTGWTAPADCAEKYKYSIFDTYTTGPEVTNDNGVVKLRTIFSAFSIAGSVPGMITIGNMSLKLTSAGNSTSSVSGGIQFRNTPDRISVDYKPVSSTRVDNWRMLLTATGANGTQDFLYSGSFNNLNSWQNASLDLNFKPLGVVNMINLTLNASHDENADNYGGTAVNSQTSEVHFDNVVLYYNSLLADIMVDGVSLTGFDSNTFAYADTIDAEYLGYPEITMIGQVEDQQHYISWLKKSDGGLVATITSFAEDGSSTTYMVSFYRPKSTINTPAGIFVNGTLIDGFSTDITSYQYSMPNQYQIVPDIMVVAGSEYQTLAINTTQNQSVITVTAENGSVNTYTINFVEQKDDVTALKSLTVSGTDIAYSSDNKEYTVNYSGAMPSVVFEKTSDGQQVTFIEGDTAILNVTAQNGVSDSYYIYFVKDEETISSALSMIAVNDELISEFDRNVYRYSYTITNDVATVSFGKDNNLALVSTSVFKDSILVEVFGNDTSVYVIDLQYILGSSATLSNCTYNGATVDEFLPAQTMYQRTISRGTYADIVATAADNASIYIDFSLSSDTVLFEFNTRSEDLIKNQITDFALIYGKLSNTSLTDIYVNGESISTSATSFIADADFDENITEYNIILKSESPKMKQPNAPSISVMTKEGQQVVVEQNGIDADSYITVTAENGDSKVYTLSFAPQLSANNNLNDIAINYVSISGFNPDILQYAYEKKSVDENITVSYKTADAYQSVETTITDTLVTLVVTAEDNSTRTYTIDINYSASHINTIENILLDGTPLPGFDKNDTYYQIDLPIGTTSLPTITIVPGADNQQITVDAGAINDTANIHVIAGDGTERDYNIYFNLLLSEVNTLSMINVDGNPLVVNGAGYTSSADFNPNVFMYNITLPIGTRVMPEVTYVEGDEYQTVRLVESDNRVEIYVTAQDTAYANVYVLNYIVLLSQNAQLSALGVNGVSLPDFAPGKYSYTVDLPIGTEIVPEVTWTQGDQWQTINYFATENVNGTATIVVKAEDTTIVNTYTITFHRILSSVDTLAKIFINGAEYTAYDAGVYQYYIELPVGTTKLPLVEWLPGDAYQTVDTISGGVKGDLIFTVTAENGSINRYIIHFSVAKSTNSYLSMISVAGNPIANFDMEIFSYEITMPYGSTQVPHIAWIFSEPDVQYANYIPASSLADTAKIVVTAEDGISTTEYRVYFRIEKSDNAQLKAIYIGGELISTSAKSFTADSDFNPETNVYNIVFPYGTEVLPEITYEGVVADYSSITIDGDTVHGTTTITVVSQNELVINEYQLNFSVRLSDNAYLRNLNVKGLINDFDSLVFTYHITFPIGTKESQLPKAEDVIFEKALPTQTVTVTQTHSEEIVITVIAEDGVAINAYVITFEILLSNNTLLSDILVNGVSIDNFSPTQFDYTYYLFHGSLLPTLEGIKSEESQIVDVTMGTIDDISYIYVEAEDGSVGEYRVHFKTTDINPGEKPSMDDVKWTELGDGYYKASSIRDNVIVRIYQTDGLCIRSAKVGLVDPNDNIKEDHEGGTILYFEEKHQCYIYVFIYNKKVVLSGKFIR